jgi:putative spermidine/putrescine transport system permease protein
MTATLTRPQARPRHGVLGALWRRPWLRGTATLSAPLLWLTIIYFLSLVVLLVTAFWSINPLTNGIDHSFTLENFRELLSPTYLTIIGRTLVLAAAVTVTDAIIAFPLGYFMARVASPRTRRWLMTLTVLPLWASYLAKVYAWLVIMQGGGALSWVTSHLGLGPTHLAYTNVAMWIVFSYIWLPFMIAPVFSALEKIPESYLQASADMGARGWTTLRRVIFPLAVPGVVAGSIFTFSLTLGDFVTPILIGGKGSSFIGNVVYDNVGVAGNLPFAAAMTVVPIIIMIIYLSGARFTGAFEEVS